jgi:hypothetical protein
MNEIEPLIFLLMRFEPCIDAKMMREALGL